MVWLLIPYITSHQRMKRHAHTFHNEVVMRRASGLKRTKFQWPSNLLKSIVGRKLRHSRFVGMSCIYISVRIFFRTWILKLKVTLLKPSWANFNMCPSLGHLTSCECHFIEPVFLWCILGKTQAVDWGIFTPMFSIMIHWTFHLFIYPIYSCFQVPTTHQAHYIRSGTEQ